MSQEELLAFPTVEERFRDGELNREATHGMTLRDYFAAKAMQGFMGRVWGNNIPGEELISIWAKSAYALADAMLTAREH